MNLEKYIVRQITKQKKMYIRHNEIEKYVVRLGNKEKYFENS